MTRVRPQHRTRGDGSWLPGLALGAAVAFLFDPVQGRRRRALLRDWLASRGHQLEQFGGTAGGDPRNRTSGVLAEGRAGWRAPGSEPGLQGGAVVGEDRQRFAFSRTSPALRVAALGVLAAAAASALRSRAPRPLSASFRPRRTVREVMSGDPVVCSLDTRAADAARLMKERHIGDVLVCDGDRLAGIVTDRDLAVRVLGEGARPERPVRELLSKDVVTVSPDDAVERAVALMRQRAVRRLPVCERDGRVIGIVSLGDLAIALDPHSALAEISAAPANA